MNEQNNTAVAEKCLPTYRFIKSRPSQRPNVEEPLESSGSFNGQRVANPAQSAASEGKCEGCAKANMERVCLSRCGNLDLQEKPRETERLETVGDTPGDSGKSLHSEIETDWVNSRPPTGDVCTENVMRLLAYQKYRCALTGRELTPETAALDHIVPIRLGGNHAMENVQVLHKDVNRAKGSLTNETFIDMCREVVTLWRKLRPGSATFGEPAADGAVHRPRKPAHPAQTCAFSPITLNFLQ
jgi:5-methylcytosine-specific restriction endonuclease McrA